MKEPIMELKAVARTDNLDNNDNGIHRGDLENENNVDVHNDFSAEEFVKNLLSEGSEIPCDSVTKSKLELPPYYDEAMFKNGQKFFYKHFCAVLLSNLFGLIALLAAPTADVLIMTNKSNTPMTAYRRYLATIFHMCSWYDGDFKTGSSPWSSICKVRKMHDSVSKRSSSRLNYKINQKDMAGTVFGFMGFALIRSEMVGIHNATEEEWKSFIHFWRVIGYILGVEDRFNICRKSVRETREVCHLLNKELIFMMDNKTEKFENLSRALVTGMQALFPFLDYDIILFQLHMVMENTSDTSKIEKKLKPLNTRSKSKLNIFLHLTWLLQFHLVRVCFNYSVIFVLWLMKVCPIGAYLRFGIKNSHVKI